MFRQGGQRLLLVSRDRLVNCASDFSTRLWHPHTNCDLHEQEKFNLTSDKSSCVRYGSMLEGSESVPPPIPVPLQPKPRTHRFRLIDTL